MKNTPRTTDSPEILHVPEVAEMLNTSSDSLWYAIKKGTAPPSAKVLGRRVFRRSEVLDWIEHQFKEQNA